MRAPRERHGGLSGPVRPPSMFRLVAALVLVGFAIWYLSRLAG